MRQRIHTIARDLLIAYLIFAAVHALVGWLS